MAWRGWVLARQARRIVDSWRRRSVRDPCPQRRQPARRRLRLGAQSTVRARASPAEERDERRRDDGIAAVFSSDLRRAVETTAIASPSGKPPVLLDWRLRECDYGDLNGTSADTHVRDRARYLDRPYPGGESWRQAVARSARWLDDLPLRWSGARVLVVGHVASRWALDHHLDGVPLETLVAADFVWQGKAGVPDLDLTPVPLLVPSGPALPMPATASRRYGANRWWSSISASSGRRLPSRDIHAWSARSERARWSAPRAPRAPVRRPGSDRASGAG